MQRRSGGTVFERGDKVLEYWLAHSEGFDLVRGSARHRVAGVVVDPADGRARTMLVHTGTKGRTQTVPAARVDAVDPFEKVLYLAPRPSRRRRAVAAARTTSPALARGRVLLVAACRGAAAWAVPRLRVSAARVARAASVALAWSLPRLRTQSRRAATGVAAGTRAGAAWCRPRVHAAGRRLIVLAASARRPAMPPALPRRAPRD